MKEGEGCIVENLICPLLHGLEDCRKENCAWWIEREKKEDLYMSGTRVSTDSYTIKGCAIKILAEK